MSEPEKIKDVPKPPPEQPKETPVQKTTPSAFDKLIEQQKLIQQSPVLHGKLGEQGAQEHKVAEVSKWQDRGEERRKKDDSDEKSPREKIKQKDKGSETVTRDAITRSGEKKGSGHFSGGGSGQGSGGFGESASRKQIVTKKLSDLRGLISELQQKNFSGKMAQAQATAMTLKPQQMQALVNQIVQAIHVGKNHLGAAELRLILKEHVFAGLRLRFTSKHGKVSIQFETADRKVKDLFTGEANKIRAALEEKGVAVDEIKVV